MDLAEGESERSSRKPAAALGLSTAAGIIPGRLLLALALCGATGACTTPYEGRYSFYDGWREAQIARFEPFEKLPSNVVRQCRAGPSSQMTVGTIWAVVRYRSESRTRLAAVPVPPSETFTVGEAVYANVSACSPDLRKRATGRE
jgi:hypothetical protein